MSATPWRLVLAQQEAGHAIAAGFLGVEFNKVTIEPDPDVPDGPPSHIEFSQRLGFGEIVDLETAQRWAVAYLAGPPAEEAHTGRPSPAYEFDKDDARQMLTRPGVEPAQI